MGRSVNYALDVCFAYNASCNLAEITGHAYLNYKVIVSLKVYSIQLQLCYQAIVFSSISLTAFLKKIALSH